MAEYVTLCLIASFIFIICDSASAISPYLVLLKTAHDDYLCAGAIIKERWAMTAAHCVIDKEPQGIMMIAGTNNLKEGGITYDVYRIVSHGGYNPKTEQNDIALLQTTQYIQFTELIRPIALPDINSEANIPVILAGWRLQNTIGSQQSFELQTVKLYTISNELCSTRIYNASIFGPNQLCTDGQEMGTCQGYSLSGSPLVSEDQLIGIASYDGACVQPIVFTRVYSYISWARRYIGF